MSTFDELSEHIATQQNIFHEIMAVKLTELDMSDNWSIFYKSKENSFFLKVSINIIKLI